MPIQENGVYWPFKSLLTGSGITIAETPTTITIGTTGAGPGGGDMLSSVYATNGQPGVVDKALNVIGTIAHASLADTVPWGGIAGVPTSFPSDWSSITNKPAAFFPLQHASTHLIGGSDALPLASASGAGFLAALSGKVTDMLGGDGVFRDLNTQVGANPLNMAALLTCNAGATVASGGLRVNGAISVTTGPILISAPQGWSGVISAPSTTWAAGFAFADGADTQHDSCVIAKGPGGATFLSEIYYNAAGTQLYNAEIMTVYNPNGAYTMRNATRIIGVNSLPGDSTAWGKAPFLSQSIANGGFAGYGMVSQNSWGCALGAYGGGMWLATSSNTFVQLTNANGLILPGALAPGYFNGSGFVFGSGLQVNGGLVIGSGDLSANGGNINVPNQIICTKEVGLGSTSWSAAPIRIQTNSTSSRPGIGLWDNGHQTAVYFYYDQPANRFRWIDSGGAVHQLSIDW